MCFIILLFFASMISGITGLILLNYFYFLVIIFQIILIGIGGGVFFVPIMMLCTNYIMLNSVASSNLITVGIQLYRYLISFKYRNPYADRPIIDYKIAAMFSPAIFIGSIFGVPLSSFLPTSIIMIFFIIIIAYNAIITT